MRIAVLADIHGNLPALRAVLAEIDREPVDALVVAGDVVGGPLVRQSLTRLDARAEPAHWLRGNSEREAVAVYDGAPASEGPAGTVATPGPALTDALDGVGEPLVVGGHTHRQFIRRIDEELTYVNAGSIGLPYEGRAGAFWMIVADGVPELRETGYDLEAAVAEMRASGLDGFDAQLERALLQPADPDAVAALLERMAGRG